MAASQIYNFYININVANTRRVWHSVSVDLAELRVFLTVASERSFSRAAARLHRTQPAVSQAVKRLEGALGEQLIDRSSRDGRLTEAGRLLRDYADRLLRLSSEAETAVRTLRSRGGGRVLIGANEAGIDALLPLLGVFRRAHPDVEVEVRRVAARQIGGELATRGLDFGVLSFAPAEAGLHSIVVGEDELVMLAHPSHRFARRATVAMADVGREVVIAHNESSPARDRVLRTFERKHQPLNIQVSLPSLDAIKRAVEMKLGVAILPRRCALAEIARGQLAAVRIDELRLRRRVRLVYRLGGQRSHAADAFLEAARAWHEGASGLTRQIG